jgi:hypothetical protein
VVAFLGPGERQLWIESGRLAVPVLSKMTCLDICDALSMWLELECPSLLFIILFKEKQ